MIHYYFRVLVIEHKLVSADYFLHKMQLWELYDILRFIPYADKSSWEQTRLLSLMIAQKFCKKRLKLKDMFELPWDYLQNDELSVEERQQQENLQNDFLEFLNNNDKHNGSRF